MMKGRQEDDRSPFGSFAMLYFALIISLVPLLVANGFVFFTERKGFLRFTGHPIVLGSGVLLFLMTCASGVFLPPVMLLLPLLVVAVGVWPRSRRWLFVPFSCGLAALVFGLGFGVALHREQEYDQLRAMFPYESMEERLPAPSLAYHLTKVPEE